MLPPSNVPTNKTLSQQHVSENASENFGGFSQKAELTDYAAGLEVMDNEEVTGHNGILVGRGIRTRVYMYILDFFLSFILNIVS